MPFFQSAINIKTINEIFYKFFHSLSPKFKCAFYSHSACQFQVSSPQRFKCSVSMPANDDIGQRRSRCYHHFVLATPLFIIKNVFSVSPLKFWYQRGPNVTVAFPWYCAIATFSQVGNISVTIPFVSA